MQILRAVDKCIAENEPTVTGRKRLVLVHGNRYLLHIIIGKIQQTEGFNTQYIEADKIETMVMAIFAEVWEHVYTLMEEHFAESYPAHIFKNVGRLKILES